MKTTIKNRHHTVTQLSRYASGLSQNDIKYCTDLQTHQLSFRFNYRWIRRLLSHSCTSGPALARATFFGENVKHCPDRLTHRSRSESTIVGDDDNRYPKAYAQLPFLSHFSMANLGIYGSRRRR